MREGFIYINNNIFSTLLAISEEEQAKGLMHQEWPPPAMTFVYPQSKINKFWMHNTPSPLDIIFCHNNKVSELCYGEPFSTRMIGSDKISNLIIELPYGTVDSFGIKVGHKVDLIKPSMVEIKNIIAKEDPIKFYKF